MSESQEWRGYEQRGEAERSKRITMDEARKMMSDVLQAESNRNMRDYFTAHGPWDASSVMKALERVGRSGDVRDITNYAMKWNRDYADAMLKEREN